MKAGILRTPKTDLKDTRAVPDYSRNLSYFTVPYIAQWASLFRNVHSFTNSSFIWPNRTIRFCLGNIGLLK